MARMDATNGIDGTEDTKRVDGLDGASEAPCLPERESAATHAEHLERLRAQARDRVEATTAALRVLVHDRSSLNDDDEHDPDGAPLSAEWSLLSGQAEAARSELQLIDAALLRVRDRTFGICESCGEPISEVRLRVRPFAERCVACSERPRRGGRQ